MCVWWRCEEGGSCCRNCACQNSEHVAIMKLVGAGAGGCRRRTRQGCVAASFCRAPTREPPVHVHTDTHMPQAFKDTLGVKELFVLTKISAHTYIRTHPQSRRHGNLVCMHSYCRRSRTGWA